MATLTEVSYKTKLYFRYFIIGLIVYFALKYGLQIGIAIYKKFNPPPPPPPTMGFGYLPKINFPQNPSYKYNFELKTPTGTFPDAPDRVNVYYMPYVNPGLFAFQNAQKKAISLSFDAESYKKVDNNIYLWQKKLPATLNFESNIITGSFKYNYAWQSDESILEGSKILTAEIVNTTAKEFFSTIGPLPTDIDFINQTNFSYFVSTGTKFKQVSSPSEADFARSDYFRSNLTYSLSTSDQSSKPIEYTYSLVTANKGEGNLNITISKTAKKDRKVIEANYNYYPIDYLTPETYPVKSAATAWEELKSGTAYIASNNSSDDVITIRRIKIAYYDPLELNLDAKNYLQPVWVFEGDDNFSAYVWAIDYWATLPYQQQNSIKN